MAEKKGKTHIVIKITDTDYLELEEVVKLWEILRHIERARGWDEKKTDNRYYVCNIDEPYAEDVLKVILDGEDKKPKEVANEKRRKIDVSSEFLPERF